MPLCPPPHNLYATVILLTSGLRNLEKGSESRNGKEPGSATLKSAILKFTMIHACFEPPVLTSSVIQPQIMGNKNKTKQKKFHQLLYERNIFD